MGAGKDLARAKQAKRALATASTDAGVAVATGQITAADVQDSTFGKDAPIATLIKWRGEIWNDLSWGQVVSIMQQAETTGATETWARLTRRMYQDGRILAVRGTRLDPISGADFDVSPGGPEDIDIAAALDVEEMLRSIPELPKALDGVLDAVFVGWSVEEIIWTVRGAWVWPSRLDILEPHRFRFTETIEPYLYDDGRLGTDPGANPQIRLMGKPLRANKYIIHMPRVLPDYPIASGLLRACARYWWPKWQAAQYWLGGAEVAGNPRAIGKYPTGTPTNVRQEFYNQLQELRANGAMLISNDSDVTIHSPSAQGGGSVWTGITEWCDTGITLTVLGSELNTEGGVGGGNRALGESQGAYTIDPRLVKDSSAMWSTIKRDLVAPFLRFNLWRYGGRMPALPEIKSRFAEDLEPQVDDLLISVGGATVNEARKSRGFEEWTAEQGGNAIAKKDAGGGFGGAFSAPAGSLGQEDANTAYASGGAPAARPLAPWDLVDQMSREAE